MQSGKSYIAHYHGHIESIDYSDGQCHLWLQKGGSFEAPRIYCSVDTGKLPRSSRERIIENLCDFYESAINPTTVVLDDDDKDREEIENLIARLAGEGKKITIEFTNVEKAKQSEEEWQLKWLSAGKKLKVGDIEIQSEEEYRQWKKGQHVDRKTGIWSRIRGLWKRVDQ